MRRGHTVFISVGLALSLLWGCASMQKGTTTGAIIGGITGAIAGGLLDKDEPARGVLIGGVLGAVAGGLIGHYYDRKVAGPPDQPPPKELQLTMDHVWTEPGRIEPGKSTKLSIEYTLLAPDFEERILVRERFSILAGGKSIQEFGPLERRRDSGTYSSYMDVGLPKDLSEGVYTMKGVVEAGEKVADGQTSFELVKLHTPEGYGVADNQR